MSADDQRAENDWHRRSADEACARLEADLAAGLATDEAARRLERDGPNRIEGTSRRRLTAMIAAQFADVMILVLVAAAVVSGVFGELADTLAIVVILVLNATIGAVQEYRAERAIAALKRMAAPRAEVLRDGRWRAVAADELVRGDVARIEAGNVVTADLRLFEVGDLAIDESPLTGESLPVEKDTTALAEERVEVGDRTNMAFGGTLVARGRGAGLVVATGMATELGRIARLISGAEDVRTPLQRRLARFGRNLALAVLGICALIFGLGLLRGEEPLRMFLTAASLAVAAVPEALPAVVTVSLAIGARRMVRQNALVRRLPAVETLGSVTVACADKTGTLTQNRMRVGSLVTAAGTRSELPIDDDGEPWTALLRALALNQDCEATPGAEGLERIGDPTEVALVEAAEAAGHSPEELARRFPRKACLAFDGARQRMTTVHGNPAGDGDLAIVKGSPEAVLARSQRVLTGDGPEPLDRATWIGTADRLARSGARVLAFAQRSVSADSTPEPEALESELVFLGLAALVDPLRPGTRGAVQESRAAGLTPVMITGDHPGTALAIARELGLAEDEGEVATGVELERLEPAERSARMCSARVFARVSPEQKIEIVRALQAAGEFVAMTGDGVNDAPALKQAEIGIAMGARGTEVARAAADMVLIDDDFATIVVAIREGRRVYDNVRRFVRYTMTSNSGEIWTLLLAPLCGLPIPLTPIQILWINLVTDGLPGLALSAEPAEPTVMKRPPRPPGESIFAHGLGWHVFVVGLLIGLLSIAGQAWAVGDPTRHWPSVVFTVLTFSQLAHALVVRSETRSSFALGLRSNPWIVGAVILTVALQLAVLYAPPLQRVFGTRALSATELGLCFLLPGVVFGAVELEKLVRRRRARRAGGAR